MPAKQYQTAPQAYLPVSARKPGSPNGSPVFGRIDGLQPQRGPKKPVTAQSLGAGWLRRLRRPRVHTRYSRNLKPRMMAGSQALPAQTWKKQMILMTRSTTRKIAPAIGTMMIQTRTAMQIAVSTSMTVNFSA